MPTTETPRNVNGRQRRSSQSRQSLLDREPPSDLNAELCLLGSIILLPSVMDEVSSVLPDGEGFYDSYHAVIYMHLLAMYETHGRIDDTLLVRRLKDSGDYEASGGAAYISKIVNAVPNAAHATYYAEIVAEKSRLRVIIESCTVAISDAYSQLPSEDVLGSLDGKLSEVEIQKSGKPRKLAEVMQEVIDSLTETELVHSRAMIGIPTVDEVVGPILGGEVAIVAARTSMGKTSFAQGIALHSAKQGRPALFVSLEMCDMEIARRELCRMTGIDSRHIRARTVGEHSIARLVSARYESRELPFYLWSPSRASVAEIRAVARKMASGAEGLSLIAIDMIGWISAPREASKSARHEQIRAISAALKSLAREMRIPVIVLAQLNREADGEEPRLAHLRDGGRIEEDADIVLFLHDNPHNPPETRSLIVAKHRSGQIGQLTIGWHAMTTTFSDAPQQY